jgi:hypothetical protein
MIPTKTSAALLPGTYRLPSPEPSKPKRYSISVTGAIYDRLRETVTDESVASFVEDAIATALDDPKTAARIAATCAPRDRP